MKKLLIAAAGASVLAFGSIAVAQWEAHPHLRAASDHIAEALAELRIANDGRKQYGGHRDTAEQLLHQAQGEIRAAAEFANSHH
jgi:hypothetical protein